MKMNRLTILAGLILGLGMICSPARAVILTATDDAEVREQNPERMRGSEGMPVSYVGVQTTGPWTELSVRETGGQNTASLVKFDLSGITVGDVNAGKADFWLHVRDVDNSNPDGVRVYGVAPGAANLNWDELTVHYRDSGYHNPNAPSNVAADAGGLIVLTDAACGFISGGNCPPAGTQYDFGANPALATAAPGLAFENAPYSRNAVDLANSNGTQVQPGYAITAASGTFADVAAGNLPILTRTSQDLDAGQGVLLGFLNWEDPAITGFPSTLAEIEGQYVHFTTLALGQDDPSSAN